MFKILPGQNAGIRLDTVAAVSIRRRVFAQGTSKLNNDFYRKKDELMNTGREAKALYPCLERAEIERFLRHLERPKESIQILNG